MGIQINGQTDTISASDGSLTVSGYSLTNPSNINSTGIITAASFVGDGSQLTGLSLSKVLTIGVRVGTAVTFDIATTSFDILGRSENIAINI